MRLATEQDIEWIARCHWDAYREHTTADVLKNSMDAYIELARNDIHNYTVYVDDNLRGYIVVDTSTTSVMDDKYCVAFLKRSYIKPEYRGTGVYKAMKAEIRRRLSPCAITQVLTEEEYEKVGGLITGVFVCDMN